MNSEQTPPALELNVKMRSGNYCAACGGVSLVLYYGKPMHELAGVVAELLNLYQSFIPKNALRSLCSPTGLWKPLTKPGVATLFRGISKEKTDYASIILSSGEPPGNIGDYGFYFFGSNFHNPELYPQETCSVFMYFPYEVLTTEQRQRFEEFVIKVTDVAPFESGFAGYAFKNLAYLWRNEAMQWISEQAAKYLAFDIGYDSFDNVARRWVVNVSWITLLGHIVSGDLGGVDHLREQLSPEVRMRSLKHCNMLVAGETPPIGDVNNGLQDLRLLKEVAAVTKRSRAHYAIGFGSKTFRKTWLNRIDDLQL
jgi:hypothetical protein